MNTRSLRRVSIWLIAMLLFGQASIALAACSMERGTLTQALEHDDPCGDCKTHVKSDMPQYANRCLAHCTSDLQLSSLSVMLVRAPAETGFLTLPRVEAQLSAPTGLLAPPPGAPPRRIVLHSFLI